MTRTTTHMIQQAADFIWLTGGLLDQRRMSYFTGDGDAAPVAAVVAAHRAEGGYAFGLEPDIKGPKPQPITAMTALERLDEVDALDAATGAGLCDWLTTLTAADGGVPAITDSIRPYPRPPWIQPAAALEGQLLSTARIAGLLLKHQIAHPWLDGAVDFCWQSIDALDDTHPYEAESAVAFLDHAPDRARARATAARLGELVRAKEIVLLDPAHPESATPAPGYAPGEFHYAYHFARTPGSLAAEWFTDAELAAALDHLAAAQEIDGGWQIHHRRWAPTTESDGRGLETLSALITLRAWD